VLCGQACAEPTALTSTLGRVFGQVGPFEVFVGPVLSNSFDGPETAAMRFASYGAMGKAARLARAGQLDVWPMHYSAVSAAFADGRLRADVVLLQLAVGPDGYYLALSNDYVVAAARHARSVIVEVNAAAPWCPGAELDPFLQVDAALATDHDPVELSPVHVGDVERAIARNIADIVPDRATLQIGIGVVPDAALLELSNHHNLGIHSGVVGDRVVELIERGVVTNAYKSVHRGLTVTNTVIGTGRSRIHINGNPDVHLVPSYRTHSHAALASQEGFVAINSALEVDLSGQVNAEMSAGQPVGGTGGMVDFLRGARSSRKGMGIVALRATDRSGEISRIVPRVEAVTVARSDVDIVVTEFGAARLGALGARERARALIGIAAPQHRDALERSLRDVVGT
jgi:acyl-CoA hydrolase